MPSDSMRKPSDGKCPAKTKRKVLFCSASLRGLCKYGFNAIDRKGQCYTRESVRKIEKEGESAGN